jgi:glycosyltransferase involved in cell wall biosynthesis
MKVLVVSFAFPPSNVIGAVRVGKLARFLDQRGHDVRVLTTDIVEDRSLPLEISRERVCYTEYRARLHWHEKIAQLLRGQSAAFIADQRANSTSQTDAPERVLWEFVRRQYMALIHIPDMRADWLSTAVPAGAQIIEGWKPEIIFGSAPPNSGLIVASRLARAYNIPWIADFRDLWVDNPYYSEPGWRKLVDAILERRVLRRVAGLVTVSSVWAEQLRRRHGKPVTVVHNGYAAEDFPPAAPKAVSHRNLIIRYMGSIYRGFRDPSPLFSAVALLPDQVRACVNVEFFSDAGDVVFAAAARHRVESSVTVKPRVPYRRALELQMDADILLLLQSSDPREEGNLPAKLFEYLYARRPILFIGYQHGIAARVVLERNAGLVSNSPAEIRDQLQRWYEDKRAGRIEGLDRSVSLGFSRDEQYAKLEHFFEEILKARGDTVRSPVGETAVDW